MIPITDGSKADAFFNASKDGHIVREAIVAAIARGSTLATQLAALAVPGEMEGAVVDAVQAKVQDIDNTALDAAVDVLISHYQPANDGSLAGIAAAGAMLLAGGKWGAARHDLYRAGAMLGDAEAIASGNPEQIARRAGQHVFWRAFGRLGRAIFRKL